ncbi:MAG: zinc ribbon domain-containing protein [Desulfomonilia bacterium]|nr:zinc ribbon domain-containing protein [Desulfomonilia bacterium]
MPIYEYVCQDCGNEFETLVSLSAKKNPPCPNCKSTRLRKKISLVASEKGGCGTCTSRSSACSSGGFT